MLTAHNLQKAYGLNPILKDITFSINAGNRIGLIGPNGSGKSTLMRLLIGQEQPDKGAITMTPPDLRIGYLAQGFDSDASLTINQLVHQTIGDPETLEKELTELASALAQHPEDTDLQLAYDKTLSRLSETDFSQIQSTLDAFDLTNNKDLPVSALSGGQKTRLSLALLLANNPQILLLDEPTNHLDIKMLEWLEIWLTSFKGGVFIVSHDRTFLDRTVNRIISLDPETHTIREYAGNYTDYLEAYVKEQEKQLSAWKDQEYEIRRMKQDIARTREQSTSVERSTTPRQPNVRRIAKKVMNKAKSREKKLERYLNSDERVEKPKRGWQMKFELEDSPHLGKDVLSLTDLVIGYEEANPLLSQLNLQLLAGQRVVLTGPNGTGKTTLLRTIADKIRPLSGNVHIGASVRMGYMSQEQDTLDPNLNAVETIREIIPMNQTEARSFLHYFLFTGDDSLRLTSELSFGERARLSLAKLVANGCNLLLLDEPINHLDIPSRTRFEEALSQFKGTILAVVHDRYFIEHFANAVWEVDEGKIRVEL